ncbi:uncharacterized protein B0T15DRAFT_412413 [Chaetomium strumarium]|uniref:CCHC-type domain-containing protein n=1 Tax=Chaetomium strumarium TaxID=1170767 RepID=A0AAJ0M291_9PEZI|nr:hypothetical protein B0T15DRAFT_412413 [Chaetomium strumarium]
MTSNQQTPAGVPPSREVIALSEDTARTTGIAAGEAAAAGSASRRGTGSFASGRSDVGPPSRRSRKRQRRDVEDFRLTAQSGVTASLDDVKWNPKRVHVDPGSQRLENFVEHKVFSRYEGPGKPQILEASTGEVNWYAKDPNRPGASYVMKWVADDDDRTDHPLLNTLRDICKRHNAPVVNMHVECLPLQTARDHRVLVRGPDQAASQAPARKILAPVPRKKQQDADTTMVPVDTAPSAGSGGTPRCGNCGRSGHKVKDCWCPCYHYGSIKACGVCNSNSHFSDKCPKLAGANKDSKKYWLDLFELFYKPRVNKPQLRSAQVTFFQVLEYAEGEDWLPDGMLEQVIPYPWTNEFAISIAKSKPGDAILRGRLHPSQFDPQVHNALEHLPVDPRFEGKTLMQVVYLTCQGRFADQKFITEQKAMG